MPPGIFCSTRPTWVEDWKEVPEPVDAPGWARARAVLVPLGVGWASRDTGGLWHGKPMVSLRLEEEEEEEATGLIVWSALEHFGRRAPPEE